MSANGRRDLIRRLKFKAYVQMAMWAGSSVGIATGYGLEGPGIESRWGRDLPHLSKLALGPTLPPVQ